MLSWLKRWVIWNFGGLEDSVGIAILWGLVKLRLWFALWAMGGVALYSLYILIFDPPLTLWGGLVAYVLAEFFIAAILLGQINFWFWLAYALLTTGWVAAILWIYEHFV